MIEDAPPDFPGSTVRVMREEEVPDDGLTVGKSDTVADLKGVTQSWVSVAQDKKCLKKYDVEISTKNGKHTVEIPYDVLTNAAPLWEAFLVWKFLNVSPHVAKVHMVLKKI